jgi:hypothetical protein
VRIVPVEAHAAVNVLGGRYDAGPGLGSEELRDRELLVGVKTSIEAPAGLPHR